MKKWPDYSPTEKLEYCIECGDEVVVMNKEDAVEILEVLKKLQETKGEQGGDAQCTDHNETVRS